MTDDILFRRGLTPVINAAGTMTALGSSRILPEAVAEMAAIADRFLDIEALHDHASAVIARATGAEAGFITACAAAALTLASAAAITGDDLAAIEALPDTRGREARIAVQAGHLVHYGAPVGQAVALAGAQVVPLGTAARCEAFHLEAALEAGLAAVVHVVSHHTVREGELPLPVVTALAAARGVPVIVDMASEYDLRGPFAQGATVAIWSGHKFLSGPTSGIAAGSRRMIGCMRLQNRGIGRAMKIGKEGIAGALAALEAWGRRDHATARAREEAIVAAWLAALSGLPGVEARPHPDWTGNPITRVELALDPPRAGLFAWELAARLRAGTPAVAVRDDLAEHQRLYLDPCTLTADEAAAVARAIRTVLEAARAAGDGCRLSWAEVKRARRRHPLSEDAR
jgi:L-seryl-tRNA(Ser) seleniumtransferase